MRCEPFSSLPIGAGESSVGCACCQCRSLSKRFEFGRSSLCSPSVRAQTEFQSENGNYERRCVISRNIKVVGVRRGEIDTEQLALVYWLQAKRVFRERREREEKAKAAERERIARQERRR